jgi:ribosomal protein uS17
MCQPQSNPHQGAGDAAPRNRRRVVQGIVSTDAMAKSIGVRIERMFKHPKYKKYIRRHSKVYAHDELNEARVGDRVEIMECRPLSKLKRWRLVRIVERPALSAAAALGFATPLLPCGPLYFIVALALISGSALRGAEFMLAFGLGTVPLLWLAQSQFHWVRQKLSPLWLGRLRLSLALTAALVIGWRLRGTLGFDGPDVNNLICF